MDTTDGVLMLGAYGWAFVKPMRKLYYNLNIPLISVIVALIIGVFRHFDEKVSNNTIEKGPVWL